MLRLAKGQRARGAIKSRAEDFLVEEITGNGTILQINRKYSASDLAMQEDPNGKFAIFVLQKTNWNTSQALKAIARRFRRGVKSTGFAGTKDRTSVSTQLCSIFGVKPEELGLIHVKDISVNGAWRGADKVEMGGLIGNRFSVTAREVFGCEKIDGLVQELDGLFPNYYGEQRFGNRKTNVDVGVNMLKGDFRAAALSILTETSNETNEEARIARERLANEQDFRAALEYFPTYLKYERSMLEYLAQYPSNYANAIRKLPRSVLLMFIHSVESYIFNRSLERRLQESGTKRLDGDIVCGVNSYGFPDVGNASESNDAKGRFILGNIIGYDTKSVNDSEKETLDELGLGIESFRVSGLNELGSRGAYRVLFAPFKDFSNSYKDEDAALDMRFSLPAGAYATVFMDELLEQQ